MTLGKRIIVLGCPGSGKSTFSRRLHEITGLPLCHLDNVWWNPDGTHISRDEFDRKLGRLLGGESWILDGDYSRTYEERFRACDTVIFLDPGTDECLRGVSERLGKERPDMPWTEAEPDPQLMELVRNYGRDNRPKILSLIERYPDKTVLIFASREEADGFLKDAARTVSGQKGETK